MTAPSGRAGRIRSGFTLAAWVRPSAGGDRHVLNRENAWRIKTDTRRRWVAAVDVAGRTGGAQRSGKRRALLATMLGNALLAVVAAGDRRWRLGGRPPGDAP